MLPFSVQLKPGQPSHEQVLLAVHDALEAGQLRDGDLFPSTRDLAQELRISPKAAQRVVQELRSQGLLAQQEGSRFLVRRESRGASRTPVDEDQRPTEAENPTSSTLGEYPFPFDTDANTGGKIDTYLIRRRLAQGGMGVVFLGFDPALEREIAIKVLAPQLAASAEARQRFLREARAQAGVDHENVLPVHAVGEFHGFPYLVMPLVRGESLQTRLQRDGVLDLESFLEVAIKVASGLQAAHSEGLIHRDIKPDNVLLENPPGHRVWLADFGLARAREDHDLTGTGLIPGTPRFSSPEQAAGRTLDHRTDLFSLGSLFYTMATGVGPFDGGSPMAVLKRILDDPPLPSHQGRNDFPTDVHRLIMQLLEKDPEDRPQEATVVTERLRKIQAEPPIER